MKTQPFVFIVVGRRSAEVHTIGVLALQSVHSSLNQNDYLLTYIISFFCPTV